MTSKDLHIAVKRNDGVEYLLSRFEILDEETLFETVRKIVPAKAEEFIKILKKKQKQLAKKRNKSSDEVDTRRMVQSSEEKVETTDPVIQELPKEDEIILQGDEVEDANEADESETAEEVVSVDETLEQLLEQEKELSSKICSVEVGHKELVTKRKRLVEELGFCQKALKELQRLLGEQESKVTSIYSEYLECASQMEVLNGEKRQYMEQLDEIRNKIENLKKITICVYQNSTIEMENLPIDYIEESEIATVSRKLYELPEAEELTVKEIKTIARLQIVVNMIERSGYQAEFIFDNTKVQKFWESIQ